MAPTAPVSRRTLAVGAAWSVPALVLASAAPAVAASDPYEANGLTSEFLVLDCSEDGTSSISLNFSTSSERIFGADGLEGFTLLQDGSLPATSTYTISRLRYYVALPTALNATPTLTGNSAKNGWALTATTAGPTQVLGYGNQQLAVPADYTLYEFTLTSPNLAGLTLKTRATYDETSYSTDTIITASFSEIKVADDACEALELRKSTYRLMDGYVADVILANGTPRTYSTVFANLEPVID